ncbi:ATP-dependent dethiobiotin synthetase BioD [Carboxylicivirga sp. A043]|uniref:dethiobiotin synthase n=1 Tax=Carboxylicivirga litoralis TaxID=2816963 RepID=UPI0021CB26C4|nr:dethiobiotin synthase [Carboxylicivirga sp. A043]MCU4156140.1 ATP-dependent dethiobiotin synthetase BioD [Carboxylicivirga sp. A043]
MATYFITAIDTDAGKTFVTGLLAKYLKDQQQEVITMKLSQTGCDTVSEDIEVHRRLMGLDLLPEDKQGLTCPYVFQFPASPHLAAEMEGTQIEKEQLDKAIVTIEQQYETVLLEGVGGLMVPINYELMLVDYIQKHNFPVILVTSGRLGSINHTLLTLEVMKNRNIPLYGVIYNHYPITAPEITEDSAGVLKRCLNSYFPNALWGEVPIVEANTTAVKLQLKGWFIE